MLRVLDLFSGIGGFSLGLERAGMKTVAFCEIDPFCRRVLAKHWPCVPCFEDVRELRGTDVEAIDVICGGFPCQDISTAGKGEGIGGKRSGLWSEYARLVGEIRPAYVIVENVAALLGRGLGVLLGDLAALGYDAEWHCIPASAVGAPHRRDRIWIIATDAAGGRHGCHGLGEACQGQPDYSVRALAYADESGLEGRSGIVLRERAGERSARPGGTCPYAPHYAALSEGIGWGDAAGQWRTEPDVGRVAHGVPARVDRLRSLGNAVVPQIPEAIGRAILAAAAA